MVFVVGRVPGRLVSLLVSGAPSVFVFGRLVLVLVSRAPVLPVLVPGRFVLVSVLLFVLVSVLLFVRVSGTSKADKNGNEN